MLKGIQPALEDRIIDDFTYDAAGRIEGSVMLGAWIGSTTTVEYSYDDANRLTAYSRIAGVNEHGESYTLNDNSARTGTEISEPLNTVVAGYDHVYQAGTNRLQELEPTVGAQNTSSYTYRADGVPKGIKEYAEPLDPPVREVDYEWSTGQQLLGISVQPYDPEGCPPVQGYAQSDATRHYIGYRYSASGLLQQTRPLRSPKHPKCEPFLWRYEVHGADDAPLAVYHGREAYEATHAGFPTRCPGSRLGEGYNRLFIYAVEFRTFGLTGAELVWQRNANGEFVKRFVETDYQGSTIAVLGGGFPENLPMTDAFGSRYRGTAEELGWGQRRTETDLHVLDHRRYNAKTGSFVSPDPLWHHTIDASPYTYSYHNPVDMTDWSGLDPQKDDRLDNPLAPGPPLPRNRTGPMIVGGFSEEPYREDNYYYTQLSTPMKRHLWPWERPLGPQKERGSSNDQREIYRPPPFITSLPPLRPRPPFEPQARWQTEVARPGWSPVIEVWADRMPRCIAMDPGILIDITLLVLDCALFGPTGEGPALIAFRRAAVAASKAARATKGVSQGTNLVYQGFDKAGVVRYVGITERQAAV